MPALVCCIQIDLSENNIGAEGAKPLADALRVTASLTSINLAQNDLGVEGAKALVEGGAFMASLTSVWTPAHEHASLCLCTSDLHYFAFCMQLGLSNNRLCGIWLEYGTYGKQMGTYTAEGIIAIAEALKVTASLTKIS